MTFPSLLSKKGASARDGEGELNAGRTWRWLGIAALPPKGRISAREIIATSDEPRHNSNWSCGRSVKICKKCKKFGWFSLPRRVSVGRMMRLKPSFRAI